jgi:transcriptional regulator with XRE-family HTH domain
MKHAIDSPEALGRYIRAARIEQRLTRDELASATGFSPKFISQVEGGKPTAQIGKVLTLLNELGINLSADASVRISPEALEKASRRRTRAGESKS